MFQENVDYEVVDPERKYRMVRDYDHEWLDKAPDMSKLVAPSPTLDRYVSYRADGLTLHKDYEWNGSNLVPDTPECMRASAVHDAWCQAMRLGVFSDTEKNWDRGAQEYSAICRADGLRRRDARFREFMIKLAGEFKYPG